MAPRAVGLAAAVGIAGVIVGVSAAGPAAADPMSLTLKYTCSLQSISLPATVTVNADAPKSAVTGEPTPQFAIHAGASVSATATSWLSFVGVKTVEGTVDAKTGVSAPQGDEDAAMRFTVPRASVPESGPFHLWASGAAPSRTFSRPGKAEITVGDLMLHAVPKDASGKVFPYEVNLPCKQDPGQRNVVASFDVTGTGAASASGAAGTDGTAASGTGQTKPSQGAGASTDGGTTHPAASGSSGFTTGSNSANGTPDRTKQGATAPDSTDLSRSTAATSGLGTTGLISLAAGALVVGTLIAAAAIRFRARKR